MFDIIRNSLKVGVVTTDYPKSPRPAATRTRGRPEIAWAEWKDARPAANACPSGAIQYTEENKRRMVQLDLARCTFCGRCAEADKSIRMTSICECAVRNRKDLITRADYALNPDGTHHHPITLPSSAPALSSTPNRNIVAPNSPSFEELGKDIEKRARSYFGRSLHIREVDAGSCNGCEVEIGALNNPLYDIERFGIHFVASPRHADMLLVTGPVTRNMELALRKTYDATPDPRLVVAVGACGCSGGVFGCNYATCGSIDTIVPVDVYIPGCPPNPHALLHGILTAMGRMENK